MTEFAIVCLVLIICIVQHLLNWAARNIWDDDDFPVGGLLLTMLFISCVITCFCIYFIIKWGCQLSL